MVVSRAQRSRQAATLQFARKQTEDSDNQTE